MEKCDEFLIFLDNLKSKVIISQRESISLANIDMITLYSEIGKFILENEENVGEDGISKISKELKKAFPHMNAFSEKNLKYMYKFAQSYKDERFIDNFASKISWTCHMVLMDKISDIDKRLEYIKKIIENGWSLKELNIDINTKYEDYSEDENDNIIIKEDTEKSNENIEFKDIISGKCSPLLEEISKDPYVFDFLSFSQELKENELKHQLSRYIMEYFLELQSGFAFLGNKYYLKVGEDDYYLDMLFYNLNLKCYITVELKIGSFKPIYLGNLSFYLSLVDENLKKEEENSTIGIILCMDDEKLIVQYAFKEDNERAEYKLSQNIPEKFSLKLPTVQNIGIAIKEKFKI